MPTLMPFSFSICSLFLAALRALRWFRIPPRRAGYPAAAPIAGGISPHSVAFGSNTSVSTLPGSNVVVNVSYFEGNPHDSKILEQIKDQINKGLLKKYGRILGPDVTTCR